MRAPAGETVMTLLPTMPRPTAGPELVKTIAMLRERALQVAGQVRRPVKAQRSTGLTAPVQQRTSIAVPILAALLAVVLAAGGYLIVQRGTAKPPGTGLGARLARRA